MSCDLKRYTWCFKGKETVREITSLARFKGHLLRIYRNKKTQTRLVSNLPELPESFSSNLFRLPHNAEVAMKDARTCLRSLHHVQSNAPKIESSTKITHSRVTFKEDISMPLHGSLSFHFWKQWIKKNALNRETKHRNALFTHWWRLDGLSRKIEGFGYCVPLPFDSTSLRRAKPFGLKANPWEAFMANPEEIVELSRLQAKHPQSYDGWATTNIEELRRQSSFKFEGIKEEYVYQIKINKISIKHCLKSWVSENNVR